MSAQLNGWSRALALSMIAMLIAGKSSARSQPPPAGNDMVATGLSEQGDIRLMVNKSTIVTTSRPQKRLSVSDPTIVDVNGISPTRFLLTAKKAGSAQVIVWDDQDRSQTIDVIVESDISGLSSQLKRFANSQIEASTAQDTVVLRGHVPSLEVAQQAELLASGYGKKVANLLEIAGGQQVMLQVRVAEVSKTAIRQLGVNFGFTDGTAIGGMNIGQIQPFTFTGIGNAGGIALGVPTATADAVTFFGRGVVGSTAFDYFISALRQNNVLRLMAEPNLVAISGQEASFLAGGEFPIPVPQSGANNTVTITIAYREFGVKLVFVPIVLGDGRIRLKVAPEVSDLDFTTAVRFSGFVVPGLSVRKVATTVELGDSQTLAIAGLLNQSVTADRSMIPFLGDIPFIGAMFRSVRYQRKETELVVFVTPRLVSPMSPDQVPAAPGEVWHDPNDVELFAGAEMGHPVPNQRNAPARRYVGSYGFVPATQPVMAK